MIMENNQDLEQALNGLHYEDIYTIILFALSEMRNVPEYKTLSELAYLVDRKSLMNMLEYYGGMTVRIPTQKEFKLMVNGLLMYEYVNLEGLTVQQALAEMRGSSLPANELLACYAKITEVMGKYKFNRSK